MKKIVMLVTLALICLVLAACTVSPPPAPSPTPESPPIDAPSPNPTPEPEEAAMERTVEEFAALILRAEQVYRDLVLGDLFSGHLDEASGEWAWSEYLEEAPDLWIETPEGPYRGWNMPRWRVLPSSGFTSIAELNAAVHEYWSNDFEVRTIQATESIDYAELDGALYFFPAMASGVGDAFLGVIWELTQFEVLHQADKHATVRAEAYFTSYGELYQGTLQWDLENDRIVTRDIEWGELVLWRDAPEAIDAMVASGRWTEEQVAHNWESGWFEQQEAWR